MLLVNNDLIKKELEAQIDKYTVNEELSIFIGSWNVGGSRIQDEFNLIEWLYPKHKLNKGEKLEKTPDIYCIGCQEIVELNAGNIILTSNEEKVRFWKNCICNTLEHIDK